MLDMEYTAEMVDAARLKYDRAKRLAFNEDEMTKGASAIRTALKDIHDKKLWQDTHSTFEDYCKKKLGMSRQRAYQIIGAQNTRLALMDVLQDEPEAKAEAEALNDRQAGELQGMNPEEAAEAMKKASKAAKAKGKKMTSGDIKKVKGRVVENIPESFKRGMAEALSGQATDMEPRFTVESLLNDLDKAWSFDSAQQHTHSWHDKQDFMEKWRKAVQA